MANRISLIVIVLTVLSLMPPLHTTHAEGSTTVQVAPSTTIAGAGATFTLDVIVTDVTDLAVWEFRLFYLNTILNCTNITEGPFLKADGSTFFDSTIRNAYNATHGWLDAGSTLLGQVPGVNGTGPLAIITFQTVAAGDTPLQFSNDPIVTFLLDASPPPRHSIPFTTVDGTVHVTVPDVAVASIVTPANIALGTIAPINVTAQNLGGIPETFDVTLYCNDISIETKTVANLPGTESRILNFFWNTTLLSMGEYNLTARATTVPGETDFSDNVISAIVHVGAVDLAITNVNLLRTIVGQGYSASVNVTVVNQGYVSGTSNVTVYANSTLIETVLNITLASLESRTLTLTWVTVVNVTKGNFTVHAYVDPLPFEANTLNNNYSSLTSIRVGMPGDVVSPFGVIDMKDIAYGAKRFGTIPSAPLWDPNADIDGTKKVDMRDIAIVAKNFGKRDP
jgi:hypothetical protein